MQSHGNGLQEIVASPIYSESGGAPGRKFYVNVNPNNSSLGNWNNVHDKQRSISHQNQHLPDAQAGLLRLSQVHNHFDRVNLSGI